MANNSPWPASRHPLFMIIPLFYSRLMLKTISAGPGSPSESGPCLLSARQSPGPAPAAPARTPTILESAANSSEKRKNSAPTETRKPRLLRFKLLSDIWVIFWVQPNLNVNFKLFKLSAMQAWSVSLVGYIASDTGDWVSIPPRLKTMRTKWWQSGGKERWDKMRRDEPRWLQSFTQRHNSLQHSSCLQICLSDADARGITIQKWHHIQLRVAGCLYTV